MTIMTARIDKDDAQRLLGSLTCEKGLLCTTSGDEPCKAWDVGSDFYLICLEEDKSCSFAISVQYAHLCKCPVRLHIAKQSR